LKRILTRRPFQRKGGGPHKKKKRLRRTVRSSGRKGVTANKKPLGGGQSEGKGGFGVKMEKKRLWKAKGPP